MAKGRRIGRLLVVAVIALGGAACSKGDSSSEEGRNGRPGANAPRSTGSGTGTAANGVEAAGQSDFGNTDAMPPVLVARDAGHEPDPGETIDPDDPKCGGLALVPEVQTEVIPGNILLIFDKSGSMTDPWTGGANAKWVDAWHAVTDALTPLQDNINVAAIFFPHPPAYTGDNPDAEAECFVPPPDVAPQMPFMPGPDFLAAWSAFWTPLIDDDVDGRTPLFEAMQSADALLASSMLQGTTRVVIITDGEPNCMTDDQAAAADQIAFLSPSPTRWLAEGIQTHVVGLPGADQPNAVEILNGVATAGGTMQHISAADPMALQTALEAIVGESVSTGFTSCTIELPKEPPNPDDVHVLVVENGLQQDVASDLGTGGGWTLADDLTQIVLDGPLCDLALQGEYEKISVVFGCVDAPPLPPPKPPE